MTAARAWSSEQNIDRTGTTAHALQGYHVDSHAPPQWAREAVIYQVFVIAPAASKTAGWSRARWSFCRRHLPASSNTPTTLSRQVPPAIWLSPSS